MGVAVILHVLMQMLAGVYKTQVIAEAHKKGIPMCYKTRDGFVPIEKVFVRQGGCWVEVCEE